MATRQAWIRRIAAVVLVLVAGLGSLDAALAQVGLIPPLHGYVATDVGPTRSTTWKNTSIFWTLPSAPMGFGTILSYVEVPFSNHNALTLLPLHAAVRSWTLAGSLVNVWEVSPTDYAILVETAVHTPPIGFPIMEELLGLSLQDDSLKTLWIFHGKVDHKSAGSLPDGTACGVVISWHGRHISLRGVPVPGYDGSSTLALFAGTNTCN